MEQMADKHRIDKVFEVGEEVYLKVKRFQQHLFVKGLASKLSPKYCGPFSIMEKVGTVAYML